VVPGKSKDPIPTCGEIKGSVGSQDQGEGPTSDLPLLRELKHEAVRKPHASSISRSSDS
jgi:hypothetical protein